ncbi:MAG: TatD family hydrolase [Candidatus Heimdallarchaeota archaeon]|nr:TatD family hydrolase [Candidatus Heimdallarchaeota archaeon]
MLVDCFLKGHSNEAPVQQYHASDANVLSILCSQSPQEYIRHREKAKRSKFIIPAFGISPVYASEYRNKLKDPEILDFLHNSLLFGVIGLDAKFHLEDQMFVFEHILKHAEVTRRSIFVTMNGMEEAAWKLLNQYHLPRVVVLGYNGSLELVSNFLLEGYYFNIGPSDMYPSKGYLDQLISKVPLERIITGTGGNYQSKTHHTLAIQDIINYIAVIKKLDIQKIDHIIKQNLKNILAGDERLIRYILLIQ